jgi:uncharacterized protein YdhG (YjbR/CyaY superfamily)
MGPVPTYVDVDAYIATFPPDVQAVLAAARAAIHEAVPGSGETISYQMPTFTHDGAAFLYLGAWKRHLGVYPVPVFEGALEAEVAPFRSGRDTLQFRYRSGVPTALIGRVAAAALARRGGRDPAG